jgi:polyhydroxybutyrate depolymerase
MEFDGHTRHYRVHVPNSCLGRQVPLVVMLHGGLTNGNFVAYESKMTQKSNRDGFIVVYPEGGYGLGKNLLTWNAGGCCGPAQKNQSDDVGFIREMILQLQKDHQIDPRRIYVAGSSNGGMMAYRVGAELGDMIAAVGSVNGCLLTDGELTLRSPISVVAFNGTKDKVIVLKGGTGSMLGYKITCPPARDTMEKFATKLGCKPEPQKEVIGPVVKESYSGGADGAEVTLYSLPMAHFWPGGRRPYPSSTAKELNATDVMCEFFWAHPKKSATESTATTKNQDAPRL